MDLIFHVFIEYQVRPYECLFLHERYKKIHETKLHQQSACSPAIDILIAEQKQQNRYTNEMKFSSELWPVELISNESGSISVLVI